MSQLMMQLFPTGTRKFTRPDEKFLSRADLFHVLRVHRGWRVDVMAPDYIRINGSNISEIHCALPLGPSSNHHDALTAIYACIGNRAVEFDLAGHA